MKYFHTATAIVVAATFGQTISAIADEGGQKRRAGATAGADFRAKILKEFDADGDGTLSAVEREQAKAAMAKRRDGLAGAEGRNKGELLKQFDKDGDGKLNEAERAALREAIAKRGGAGDQRKIPAEILKRFDTDGDGTLNDKERQAAMKAREEMMKEKGGATGGGRRTPDPARMKELLKRFDKNEDGKLDDTERAAAKEAMVKMREGRGDGNRKRGDGADAAPGGDKPRKPRGDKQELLEKFDADGDGKLSEDERAKAKEEIQKRKNS